MKPKQSDERYQELFSELQRICHKYSELLDYTIIKRVTVKPVEQFFQKFLLKELSKLKHVSFTIFISKLIELESLFINSLQNPDEDEKLRISTDENEDTLDIVKMKPTWDKENQADSEAANERLTSTLIDSDIEIDPPIRTIKPSVGYPLSVRSNNIQFEGCGEGNEKSLKQLAFENLGIQGKDYQYPVNADGKIFNITKCKRRRVTFK